VTGFRVVVELPDEVVEAIARRAAAIAVERSRQRAEPEPVSPFMTVAEAAGFIRAKPQRIYDLFSDGRVTRFGSDHARLVSRAELVAFVENTDGAAR
jgi:hypothetical protein